VIEHIADRLDEVVRRGTAAFDADPARAARGAAEETLAAAGCRLM
jgi:hypothetical protein